MEENVVGFDVSAVEKGLNKVTKLFDKYNSTLLVVTSSSSKFNRAGDEIGKTVTGLNAAGDRITKTFIRVKNSFKEMTSSVTLGNKSLRDNVERIKALAEAGSAADQMFRKNSKGRYIDDKGKYIPRSTLAEIAKIEAEITAKNEAEKTKRENQERAHQAEISAIIDRGLQQKRKTIVENIKIDHQLQLAERAAQTKITELVEHGYRERQRLRLIANAQDRADANARQFSKGVVSSQASTIKRASPQAVSGFTSAVGNLSELVRSGQTNAGQIERIYDQIKNKIAVVYTGIEKEIADKVNKVIAAEKRLTQSTIAEKNKQSTAHQRMSAAVKQTAKDLVLSWETVFRFLQFRVLYAGIFSLVNAMEEGARAAIKFQIRISEIRTISQDSQLSFHRWSDEVRKLSDAFGQPVAGVAEGLYETISNQIAKGAEATMFMAKAMKFGATAVASTEDSVNLLSSALNSFNINAADTDRVAAILFKTIDLGRVRASEMADTFGRVAGLASSLGVSLEETSASIATLTINGIRYNEAFTLINNVMLKLTKPTDAMKKLFKEWGVETGTAAVATFGFVGILQKLEQATGGSADELADLFKDIRAIRGAIGLTGSSLAGYNDALRKITENSSSDYANAAKIAFESSGKQIEIELNKIKNYFISDFGVPFIEALTGAGKSLTSLTGLIATTVDVIGGGNGLTAATKNLVEVASLALKVYIAYKVIQIAVNMQTRMAITLNRVHAIGLVQNNAALTALTAKQLLFHRALILTGNAMRTMLTGPNLILAGITFAFWQLQRLDELDQEMASARENSFQRRQDGYERDRLAFEAAIGKQTKAVTDGINEQFKTRLQAAASLKVILNKEVEEQRERSKQMLDSLKDIFNVQTDFVQDRLRTLENSINKALDNIKRAKEAMKEIGDSLNERRFNVQLAGSTDVDKIKLRDQRAKDLSKDISSLLTDPNVTAEQGQENLNAALAKQKEIDTILADLADERTKAEEKRFSVLEQIQELQAQGVGQKEIEQAKAEVARIRSLETEYKSAKPGGRNKDTISTELIVAKLAAQQALNSTKDEEKTRRAAMRLASAQDELAQLDAQLALLPRQEDALKRIEDQHKKITGELKTHQAIQQNIVTLQTQQADKAKIELENLKTAFKSITEFQLKNIKTADDKNTQLAQFDKLVSGASNLTDQQTLFEINKYRVQLAKQADLEIQNHTLSTQQETIEKQRAALVKNQEDITSAIKAATETQKSSFGEIKDLYQELKAAADRYGSLGESGKLDESLKNLSNAIRAYKLNGDYKTLSKAAQTAVTEVGIQAQAFTNKSPSEIVIKKAQGADPGRSLQDTANDFQRAVSKIINANSEVNKLNVAQLEANKAQAALGVTAKTVQTQINATADAVDKFGDAFIKSMKDTTTAVQAMDVEIKNLTASLGNRNPNPSGTTAPPATPAPTTAPVNPISFNINIQSTGNANVDAVAVGRALQRKIRTGEVKLT